MDFELGSEVRDTVTGFAGIVTARADYLYGSDRCEVSPKGGAPEEPRWFEAARLERIAP